MLTSLCCGCSDFYPRSPCGERHVNGGAPSSSFGNFYPRSPCGERLEEVSGDTWARDFYPRSPCGERPCTTTITICTVHFYPRSPCGERPCTTTITICTVSFLSTLSLRRATKYTLRQIVDRRISIHALLAESDLTRVVSSAGTTDFYPRSPCGERLCEFWMAPNHL